MENDLIQRSPEWFKWRRAHLGASEASAVIGVSPWKTPLELYHEKISDQVELDNSNFAMRRGVELEPLALAKFEAETGYLMTPAVKVHPIYKWMSASLDGLELEAACAVEIKSPGRADHELALKGIVPEKYIPQLQHIMEVCQLTWMYYMSYVSDSDFIIFKVNKDNDYTAKLIAAELEFWKRIQDRNPPEPTDRDFEEISSLQWICAKNRWRDLQDEKSDIERREKELREEIVKLADNRSAYGAGLKLTKYIRKGTVDFESLVKDKLGEDFDKEPYRKPSTESWRISIQGECE